MVLHNQNVDISKNIDGLESHFANIGYKQHAIHTGPLIRRESVYANDLMEKRKRLFNTLFNYARKLDFRYVCPKIRKEQCSGIGYEMAKVFAGRVSVSAWLTHCFPMRETQHIISNVCENKYL